MPQLLEPRRKLCADAASSNEGSRRRHRQPGNRRRWQWRYGAAPHRSAWGRPFPGRLRRRGASGRLRAPVSRRAVRPRQDGRRPARRSALRRDSSPTAGRSMPCQRPPSRPVRPRHAQPHAGIAHRCEFFGCGRRRSSPRCCPARATAPNQSTHGRGRQRQSSARPAARTIRRCDPLKASACASATTPRRQI